MSSDANNVNSETQETKTIKTQFRVNISSSYLYKHLIKISSVIVNKPLVTVLEDFFFEFKNDILKIAASDNSTTLYAYLSLEKNTNYSIDSSTQNTQNADQYEATQNETNIPISDSINIGVSQFVNTNSYTKIAVPSKIILDTLKNLPEQPIELSYDRNNFILIIKSSNGKYKIMCDDPEAYPITDIKKNSNKITIQGKKLIDTIENTIIVASNDQAKPVLNSVLFEIESNKLSAVATDMPRLIKYSVSIDDTLNKYSFILNKRAVSLLKNILIDEDIFLYIDQKYIYIESGSDVFTSVLIQENYPDYKKVIPSNYTNKLFIDRLELISALKRLVSFTNGINFQIKFNIAHNKIILVAEDINNENDAYEEIMCNYEYQDIIISFNVKNLLEILQIIKTNIILISFSDTDINNVSNKAAIIEPFENNGNILNYNFLALIMPIYI